MRTNLRWTHGAYVETLRRALGDALRSMSEERRRQTAGEVPLTIRIKVEGARQSFGQAGRG
ncbi:MAG TPA: hypothetical protein VGO93_29480 [Candidatus Xenobia bacterium]